MSYSSRGKRPSEYASKINHSYLVNDPLVKGFLESCEYPFSSEEIELDQKSIYIVPKLEDNPIKRVIAIDGGRQEIAVKKNFPSSTITFFQSGALYFSLDSLNDLYIKPFIEPSDISKLREIQRYKFVMPTKNVIAADSETLTNSIRKSIYDYFSQKQDDKTSFIKTLKWFLLSEYEKDSKVRWNLAWCPNCKHRDIELSSETLDEDCTTKCPNCGEAVYLTDVFRLHEIIDDDLGATGIIGYVGSVLEQIIIIHLIKIILETKPDLLDEILFIKDGQLAFYGQTANLHKPMRHLVNFLLDHHNLFLVGLEKTGAFVEHADQVAEKLNPGTALVLNNTHIYKYITPGKADDTRPYGGTTYYGQKLIFKANDGRVYVATLATRDVTANPQPINLPNLEIILNNVEKLKSDMYDSALVPVSIANKLVSLANRPSSLILEKFAKKSISTNSK